MRLCTGAVTAMLQGCSRRLLHGQSDPHGQCPSLADKDSEAWQGGRGDSHILSAETLWWWEEGGHLLTRVTVDNKVSCDGGAQLHGSQPTLQEGQPRCGATRLHGAGTPG